MVDDEAGTGGAAKDNDAAKDGVVKDDAAMDGADKWAVVTVVVDAAMSSDDYWQEEEDVRRDGWKAVVAALKGRRRRWRDRGDPLAGTKQRWGCWRRREPQSPSTPLPPHHRRRRLSASSKGFLTWPKSQR